MERGASRDRLERWLEAAPETEEMSPWKKLKGAPVSVAWTEALRLGARISGRSWSGTVRMFSGDKFHYLFPDGIAVHILRYGFFERETSLYLVRRLSPGDAFVDVGAHFGYCSLLAARLVGERGKVISVEPTPRTFGILEKNMRPFPWARTVQAAAWDEVGEVVLFDQGVAAGGNNSVLMRGDGLSVHAVRGASLLEGVKPALIKVDTEGAELRALGGLEEVLREHHPELLIEFNEPPGSERSAAVIGFLEGIGYRTCQLREGRPVSLDSAAWRRGENLLFIA